MRLNLQKKINITVFKVLFLACLFFFSVSVYSQHFPCKDLAIKAEVLKYEANYKGIFSIGNEIAIAEIIITNNAVGDQFLKNTSLWVSSEKYPNVESIYPFRYRLNSLSSSGCGHSLAYESYRKTNKIKHQLVEQDVVNNLIRRYRKTSSIKNTRPSKSTINWRNSTADFKLNKQVSWVIGDDVQNRLSLLERIRRLPLVIGKEYKVAVNNDDEMFEYNVKVEANKKVDVLGQSISAIKIRVDAYESKKGKKEIAHSPVYIWLKSDDSHQPLQFKTHHPMGVFTIKLIDVL